MQVCKVTAHLVSKQRAVAGLLTAPPSGTVGSKQRAVAGLLTAPPSGTVGRPARATLTKRNGSCARGRCRAFWAAGRPAGLWADLSLGACSRALQHTPRRERRGATVTGAPGGIRRWLDCVPSERALRWGNRLLVTRTLHTPGPGAASLLCLQVFSRSLSPPDGYSSCSRFQVSLTA
jgi:hypothetical protein